MEELIKKSDAIEVIKRCKDRLQGKGLTYEIMLDMVERIPSADRPQGEWLDYEIPLEDGGAMPIQVCSLCKTFYPLAYTGGGHRFCPNCGARIFAKDINVRSKDEPQTEVKGSKRLVKGSEKPNNSKERSSE